MVIGVYRGTLTIAGESLLRWKTHRGSILQRLTVNVDADLHEALQVAASDDPGSFALQSNGVDRFLY